MNTLFMPFRTHNNGEDGSFLPGVNTLGWSSVLDIRYGVVCPALLFGIVGGIYGGVVYILYSSTYLHAPWLPTFFEDHSMFVAFLVTFYVSAAFSGLRDDMTTLRTIQGGGYANFFLKLRSYVSDDDPEFYIIRDLVIAASWALFGGIIPSLQDEALQRIDTLIDPKIKLNHHDKSVLRKLGKNNDGKLLGYGVSTKLLFMAAEKFSKAAKRTSEKRGMGDHVLQIQISETHANLMLLRGLFGTTQDRCDDSHGVHIAYIQMLGLTVSCLLLSQPWGRVNKFGIFTILSTATEFFTMGGMFFLGTDMIQPYSGYVTLNVRKLLSEIENSWTPWKTEAEHNNDDDDCTAMEKECA